MQGFEGEKGLEDIREFLPADAERFENVRRMFCKDATIEDYGCLGFDYSTSALGKAHLGYAILLTNRGGRYLAYANLTRGVIEEYVTDPAWQKKTGSDPEQKEMKIHPKMTVSQITSEFDKRQMRPGTARAVNEIYGRDMFGTTPDTFFEELMRGMPGYQGGPSDLPPIRP